MSSSKGGDPVFVQVLSACTLIAIAVGSGYGLSFVLPLWAAILLGMAVPIVLVMGVLLIGMMMLLAAIGPLIVEAFDVFFNRSRK